MSQQTPLEPVAGAPSEENKGIGDGNNPQDNAPSYAGIVMDDLDRQTRKQADDFHKFAIDYVAEWEKVVTTRINADMKTTEQLRRDADHYTSKVESLQANVKKLQDNNKPVPDSTSEKLDRNETKLSEANRKYNDAAYDSYLLMEEMVDRSWRDLHPLLLKTLQMEVDICKYEREVMAPFRQMINDLVDLAQKEQVKPRLKDVVDGTPESLSTRPNGVDGNFSLSFGDNNGAELPEQAPRRY